MPKSYTEKEKNHIIESLKKEAKLLIGRYGIKGTTIDELVKRVKIPKGTFYLFYRSKETLLFDIILEEHDKIEDSLLKNIEKYKRDITEDQLTDIIFRFYKKSQDSVILKMITTGDIQILFRKLPQKSIEKHMKKDITTVKKIVSMIPTFKNKNMKDFSNAFKNIFMMMIYEREIGKENFDRSFKLLIKGLVIQIME